ncbi:transmembrane protein 215 [Bombina bombina]|uniref:transmembrane protein 215 n=1 Tax=Bombina bombina TaxID=8345 RepID=UPI00235A56FB|nr:transmembrane protein 215 [Bombina bombina]
MRPDDINPRTGLVVALVSIFLVFGFMFTVSGFKGESLGDIPLIAIGPAIFLPGVAAISLARRTDGCTKWPYKPWICCKKPKDKEDVELLKTPSDMESGKGSSNELDKKGETKGKEDDCEPNTAISIEETKSLSGKMDQENGLSYLDKCYSSTALPGGVGNHTSFSAFDKTCSSDRVIYTATEEKVTFDPRDSDSAAHSESGPYDSYCCYVKTTEVNWDQETIV